MVGKRMEDGMKGMMIMKKGEDKDGGGRGARGFYTTCRWSAASTNQVLQIQRQLPRANLNPCTLELPSFCSIDDACLSTRDSSPLQLKLFLEVLASLYGPPLTA